MIDGVVVPPGNGRAYVQRGNYFRIIVTHFPILLGLSS